MIYYIRGSFSQTWPKAHKMLGFRNKQFLQAQIWTPIDFVHNCIYCFTPKSIWLILSFEHASGLFTILMFFLSTIPICCGVSGAITSCSIPFFLTEFYKFSGNVITSTSVLNFLMVHINSQFLNREMSEYITLLFNQINPHISSEFIYES